MSRKPKFYGTCRPFILLRQAVSNRSRLIVQWAGRLKNPLHPAWLKPGKWGVILFLICCSARLMALTPFVDSGHLLRPGKNEFSAHTQIISQKEGGLDFNLFIQMDEGFLQRRDFNIRYFAGIGESGFLTGSFLKWIPFPNYRYQPAIGASAGISYNLMNTRAHYLSLHLRPLISKEFETAVGKFIPYLSLPGSIRIENFSKVQFPLRLSMGIRGELFFIHFHKFECNIEFSTDLSQATASYFSIGVITGFM